MSVNLDFFYYQDTQRTLKKPPNISQNTGLFLTDFVLVGLSVYISL